MGYSPWDRNTRQSPGHLQASERQPFSAGPSLLTMEGDVQAPTTNETLPGFIPSKLQWPLTTNSDILPYSTVFKDPSLSQAAKLLLFGLTFQSHPESKLYLQLLSNVC